MAKVAITIDGRSLQLSDCAAIASGNAKLELAAGARGRMRKAAKLIQTLFGPAMCLLVYWLGRTMFGNARIGLVAAGFVALSPALVAFNNHLMSEGLYSVVLLAMVCCACQWMISMQVRWA